MTRPRPTQTQIAKERIFDGSCSILDILMVHPGLLDESADDEVALAAAAARDAEDAIKITAQRANALAFLRRK